MNMSNQSIDILKAKNLRLTPIREKVLSLLLSSEKAIANKDIEMAFDYLDRITLYRTLKSFEEKGIIHKIEDGTGVAKYAVCVDDCQEGHHHDEHVHFHCNDCGDTFCVEEVAIPKIQTPKKHKVETTSIVLNGTCESCL